MSRLPVERGSVMVAVGSDDALSCVRARKGGLAAAAGRRVRSGRGHGGKGRCVGAPTGVVRAALSSLSTSNGGGLGGGGRGLCSGRSDGKAAKGWSGV